jgi:hypothetical protein
VCRGDGELSPDERRAVDLNRLAAWADEVLDLWCLNLAGRAWGMAPMYYTDTPYCCRLTWDHGSKDYKGTSAKEARIAAADAVTLKFEDQYPSRPYARHG